MAELTTLARPYAKAAFEFANAENKLAAWSTMLSTVGAVVQQEKVKSLLASPSNTAEQQVQAIIDICGDELSDKGRNFIRTLADNKRLPLLPEIYLLFAELKAAQEKTVDVEVQTAFEIDDATLANLTTALAESLNQQVKIQTVVDSNLIGGVVIRAGDMVVDGSVRGKLAKLAERITS